MKRFVFLAVLLAGCSSEPETVVEPRCDDLLGRALVSAVAECSLNSIPNPDFTG